MHTWWLITSEVSTEDKSFHLENTQQLKIYQEVKPWIIMSAATV